MYPKGKIQEKLAHLQSLWYNKADYEYIYFSKTPYPREKAHRINEIPCSHSFVKYRFSPKLAEYILKTLPKEQTKPLDYFYCKYKREHK